MIPQHGAIFLLSVFLSYFFAVWAQNPSHTVSRFQNPPGKLFLFNDAQSAIYHDFGFDVYVSSDEGKSWALASDIPNGEAVMVILHPFDNRYAFVFTPGTTHYRTEDRGKTWQPFDVPVPPTQMSFYKSPLSFHKYKSEYILFHGLDEESSLVAYYTKNAFRSITRLPFPFTTGCNFAHSSAEFNHVAHPDLIYCVADHLLSSTDFFTRDRKIEDLGIGHTLIQTISFTIVSNFAVVAVRDLASGESDEIQLYVTADMWNWAKAQFPPTSAAPLWGYPFTLVVSGTHSLAVLVKLEDLSSVGTLFVSNSNGTFFVQSLKDTNRNMGRVDYENLYGMGGVGLANMVTNAQDVDGRYADKKLRTMITFDDGSSWTPIVAPSTGIEGRQIHCNPNDIDICSLHLHSLSKLPDHYSDVPVGLIYSSPAPGFVMGVGSIGASWDPHEGSATFLSTNAGVDWKMVDPGLCQYGFGDQGSLLVLINAEEVVSDLRYSTDMGNSWLSYDFGIKIRARSLTTIPVSSSQKFLLLGQQSLPNSAEDGRAVVVFLDFTHTMERQCGEDDFERWYVRTARGKECLMGRKQWYKRRKVDANCYIGKQIEETGEQENCPCDEEDFECDYNFVRDGNKCVPVSPERIPPGICTGIPGQTYQGSSGWRKIAGNTCVGGIAKDTKVDKKCSQAQPAEGQVSHHTFEFPSQIVQHSYFKGSTTILVRLADDSMWQSNNDGYTWEHLFPEERFLAFYHHIYEHRRAYLITHTKKFWYTMNAGRNWNALNAPTLPNTFQTAVLEFDRTSYNLIWTGDEGCTGLGENCHSEAHYSMDDGRTWRLIDKYVQKCAWAQDAFKFWGIFGDKSANEHALGPDRILCESYRDKVGSQKTFSNENNDLQLIEGNHYYSKTTKLLDYVVGFNNLSEYWIVTQYQPLTRSLDLQVSLDGRTFTTAKFPPNMHPETHTFTILGSTTNSIFLHMTMSEYPSPYWGNVLKSDRNGTLFGLSVENVNRNEQGFVDFEKVIGLGGIALVNVVSNTQEAKITKRKTLQTYITHNDGGSWKPLIPPRYDSMGRKYQCDWASCALHLHGYTGRPDPRAMYSCPSVVGLIMGVGNVGEELAPYTESDIFLSRDAGFTWEEIHKGAHLWSFGDSGSILVMASDEKPTDHVLFSTDEGLTWREYKFGDEEMRVRTIITAETSRRFILIGNYRRSEASVVVYLDFSVLTLRQCSLDMDDPARNDFELWYPNEELCLFGRQTLYRRRRRISNCVVGNQKKLDAQVLMNCACERNDFECEFDHIKDGNDKCVPRLSLPDDNSCRNGQEFWFKRPAYRKIPSSSCEGGLQLNLAVQQACPRFKTQRVLFWITVSLIPVGCLVAFWYYRRSKVTQGAIRLPDEGGES